MNNLKVGDVVETDYGHKCKVLEVLPNLVALSKANNDGFYGFFTPKEMAHYKKVQPKKEWYEDLGDGVLCWVWDNDDEEGFREIKVVDKFSAGNTYRFVASGTTWENAKPLTKEEVMELIKQR